MPVGLAASRHDEEASVEQLCEDLAVETASGAGTLRSLWKWICLQVADQLSSGGSIMGAAGRYEAAVYGVMSGNVAASLPVCSTWEDACWAYCR